ncbi:ATP-dependent DNA helicase sgs1 [Puccinia graminis f. sp. tritici]|uniref:DNA 3'-5' helicase n=1 Tax=Puccinia graminis f. sp. tritici TaxID=56615 RepID=A0A5B0QP92_PUCGR|nr:ATP-dependent DNA helicase sgs1 [Puccinia graminis f. sp. tritici]
MNLTPEIEKKIIRGDYGFIYLSPEVLLNNPMFRRIFFHRQFQSKLILTVVDEAHMIYVWGLVASGLGKKISSHFKLQDRGIFRPSYGDLGTRLLATHGVPILLLSATCRPIAIEKILNSLKILPENMKLVNGELTRPEIRLIRVPMKSSLGSCNDLKRLFSTQTSIPNNKIPPTLIYAPTRNLTWQVLRVIHEARAIQGGHLDAGSTFARRYHSCTGKLDKIDIISGFEDEAFPVISCTMALGLGQNWKRVNCVVHVGRGDPSSICQMIGRCGRGENNPGLGIMFVESNRRTGKNKINDFDKPFQQSDDDRMDAFAITPVCLRIAMSLDNLLGYIPLDNNDPNVKLERLREEGKNFTTCLCSNCEPDSAQELVNAFKHLTTDNFKENITSRDISIDVPVPPKVPKVATTRSVVKADTGKEPLDGELEEFSKFLAAKFANFHYTQIGAEHSEFEPEDHFGIFEARRVVVAFRGGASNEEIEDFAGGKAHKGQMEHLLNQINNYIGKVSYLDYLEQLEVQKHKNDKAKTKEVAARKQATLERRHQKAEETKRRNLEQAAANKRQKSR